MATTEEIERRVEENDAPRTAQRAAAAKRVSELAQLQAEAAEKLADIERELGDVLAECSGVIGVDELAAFTDIPAADLDQLLDNRKTTRPKRKRAATTSAAKGETSRKPSTTTPPSASQAPAPPVVVVPRTAADSTRTPEPVT